MVTAHGLHGELVLKHVLGKKSTFKGLQAIFIEEKKNVFLPWFIESARIKNEEESFIKLEGVDIREAARKLVQKNVYITEQEFKNLSAQSSPANLLGYVIIQEKKSLGEIQEVLEQPHQLLCKIDIRGNEVLIPLNENTLKKIDHKKKAVEVQLPDGLLDIYM